MNNSNDDFELQDLWQKTPPVDVDKLVQSVTKAHRRMRRFFYFELGSSLLALAFLAWLLVEHVLGDQWWQIALLGVIAVVAQIWMWSWRRGLWNAFAKSPRELFELKRKHLLLDIKIARSFSWGSVIGGFTGLALSYMDKIENPLDLSEIVRFSLLFAVLMFLLFCLIWGIRKERKARKELKDLEEQRQDFKSEENL